VKIAINGKSFGHSVKGGAARAGINLARAMAAECPEAAFDIFIPCTETTNLPTGWPDNVTMRVSESRLLKSGAGRSAWEQFVLPRMVKRGRYDALVSPSNSAPVLVSPGALQLLWVHDTGFLNHEWYSAAYSRYVVWLLRRAAHRGVQFITSTHTAEAEIRTIFPEIANVAVISLDGEEPPETSRPAGVEGPFILYLGSLNPRKNPEGAIAGFKEFLRGSDEDVSLAIAGGSKAIFREAALDDGGAEDTVVLGYVSDDERWALLRQARLLLFPSYLEGFGLPILEAFRVGTPVVASDIPVIRELFGEAVEYVDPASHEDIGRGITKVYTDSARREELIEAGRERARRYSWRESARRCLEIIEERSS